jgi:hypothetical protein
VHPSVSHQILSTAPDSIHTNRAHRRPDFTLESVALGASPKWLSRHQPAHEPPVASQLGCSSSLFWVVKSPQMVYINYTMEEYYHF